MAQPMVQPTVQLLSDTDGAGIVSRTFWRLPTQNRGIFRGSHAPACCSPSPTTSPSAWQHTPTSQAAPGVWCCPRPRQGARAQRREPAGCLRHAARHLQRAAAGKSCSPPIGISWQRIAELPLQLCPAALHDTLWLDRNIAPFRTLRKAVEETAACAQRFRDMEEAALPSAP